jgi:hypothetical protein
MCKHGMPAGRLLSTKPSPDAAIGPLLLTHAARPRCALMARVRLPPDEERRSPVWASPDVSAFVNARVWSFAGDEGIPQRMLMAALAAAGLIPSRLASDERAVLCVVLSDLTEVEFSSCDNVAWR